MKAPQCIWKKKKKTLASCIFSDGPLYGQITDNIYVCCLLLVFCLHETNQMVILLQSHMYTF